MKTLLVFFFGVAATFAAEADLTNFAKSSKQFTAAVYDEILVDNKENILVSSFSVETLLALTQSGAVGETGEEIRTSLFLPETKEETESLVKSVLPTLADDGYILHVANKIYVENGFEIKEDFKRTATDVYQANFQNIEFAENVNAATEINKWVEEETENKIHNLINSEDVDANTRVVLVNALYFQGNWSLPFKPVSTKKAFYTSNDKTVDTETMYQRSEKLNYFESTDLDAKFLELPFQGKDASMVIILPNKNEGIGLLEKQMKTALITPKFTQEFVEVSLPKFKIESMIDFKDVLQKLGVRSAFNPNTADFSGIAGSPGEILISKIVQKTFIDVNEFGVEAAAATAIIVAPPSVNPDAEKTFIVDHPFAFYIQVNGIVLFEGRVLEPSY